MIVSEISIGVSKQKAAELARQLMTATHGDGPLRVEFYGENNEGSHEVVIVFSNEDMERDEIINSIIVDVEPV